MPQFKDLIINPDPLAQIAVRFEATPVRTVYIDSTDLPSYSTYLSVKNDLTELEGKLSDLFTQLQLEAQKIAITKLGE